MGAAAAASAARLSAAPSFPAGPASLGTRASKSPRPMRSAAAVSSRGHRAVPPPGRKVRTAAPSASSKSPARLSCCQAASGARAGSVGAASTSAAPGRPASGRPWRRCAGARTKRSGRAGRNPGLDGFTGPSRPRPAGTPPGLAAAAAKASASPAGNDALGLPGPENSTTRTAVAASRASVHWESMGIPKSSAVPLCTGAAPT
jgi:hypothetical protein